MYIVPRERSPSNSEADTRIIAPGRDPGLASRHAALTIETAKPPTYLFSDQRFQRAQETKLTGRALACLAHPLALPLVFVCRLHPKASSGGRCSVSAASVKGYLRREVGVRKSFLRGRSHFFRTFCAVPGPPPQILRSAQSWQQSTPSARKNLARRHGFGPHRATRSPPARMAWHSMTGRSGISERENQARAVADALPGASRRASRPRITAA